MFNNNLLTTKIEEKVHSTELNTQSEISRFINLLSERIMQMEEIYVIDRLEGDYAVCENRDTGEIINIEKSLLPEDIKEGTVLKYENGNYIIDMETEEQIEKRVAQKMKNLWND